MKQLRPRDIQRFGGALSFAVVLASLAADKWERHTPVAHEYDTRLEPIPMDEAQLPTQMVRTRAAERATTPYWNRD
jgi:hypothetical protein